MSHGKRKIDGPIETLESKKKLKVPTLKKITDAIIELRQSLSHAQLL